MQMEAGLDTGPMLHIETCVITTDDTGASLHDKLMALGADALMKTLPGLITGTLNATPQNNTLACYAAKLQKNEALINWSQDAEQINRQVRAFNAWPVAQTSVHIHDENQILRIWQTQVMPYCTDDPPGKILRCDKKGIDVATGAGVLRLLQVQLPGGKPLRATDFVNAHDLTGQILVSHINT